MELLVRKLFGQQAAVVFAGVVAFALLSSLGASAFLGPRVLDTMLDWYRSKSAPKQSRGEVENSGAKAPVPASLVWLQAGLSMAMIVSGTFEQILTVTGFLLGIFPMLAVLGLYSVKANVVEKVSKFAKWFAAPLFLAGSLLILVLAATESPKEMAIATALIFSIFLLRRQANDESLLESPPSK